MKKIIAFMSVLLVTTALSIPAFAADVSSNTNQVIGDSTVSAETSNTSAYKPLQKSDMVQKTAVKNFKGKFTLLFTELKALREDCNDLWSRIKITNENIKINWKDLKESLKGKNKEEVKQIIAGLKAEIAPLHEKVKAAHSDIEALRSQKSAEWNNFREAVKSRNESKALSALHNIIDLKKQIIQKQKIILELKQEISELIKY